MIEEVQRHLIDQGMLELRLKAFYLDDRILAGGQESGAAAIELLERRCEDIGLSLNRNKCELIPTAGRAQAVDVLFLAFEVR